MNLSRRSFLGGVLSVSALTVTGLPSLATVPRIVGDGVHDDADGLEALFARQPVSIENEAIVAHDGYMRSGGKFFVGRPANLVFTGDWWIENLTIIADESYSGDPQVSPILKIKTADGRVWIETIVLDYPPSIRFGKLYERVKVH